MEAAGSRPLPPEHLAHREHEAFEPAPDLALWLHETFIAEDGPLCNPDHAHLAEAEVGCLWTNAENIVQMRSVAATAEIPALQGARWVKARARVQTMRWFGHIPDFILTFDAVHAADLEDAAWCALVEHELYHCGHQRDRYGELRFDLDGNPVYGIRGHDVEEFIGVVRRYGPGAAAAGVSELVRVAQLRPLVVETQLDLACGTCRRVIV